MMKCNVCKKNQQTQLFSKNKYTATGLDHTCKECRKNQREQRKLRDIIIPVSKICSGCKNDLENINFDKKIGSIDGLHTECKNCKKQKRLDLKKTNAFRKLPDDYVKLCSGCNVKKHKDCFYAQIYSKDGIGTKCIECENERTKKWRFKNPEKVIEYKEYFKNYKNRRLLNPHIKLTGNLRNRIRMAIKRNQTTKFNNSFELIGCSPSFMVNWLEYQFSPEMNWNNYGKYWEIDHVIPCSFFELKEREEQFKCFNWRNCRPLEASENSKKRDKIQNLQILLQEIRVHYYERHIQIAGIS